MNRIDLTVTDYPTESEPGTAAVALGTMQSPDGVNLRPFRNGDPPALVEIWNRSQLGRGAVQPLSIVELDALVLAKLHFDREGLIVACEGESPIGFVHAGFGANENEADLSHSWGVISAVLVVPQWRRRGVGRVLMSAAERYLRDRGAEVIYAGGMRPLNPFYLGLYGGAELPGFLESDVNVGPFLQACGYAEADRALVFHRDCQQRTGLFDVRFSRLRRTLHFQIDAGDPQPTWWWSRVMGLFDQLRVRLVSRESGRPLAVASCWEMVGFSRAWGRRTVGLVDVHVDESVRRQGIGKLLVSELLTRLGDEGIELAEVQTMQRNQAAVGLYRSLGFVQVDQGVIYRRS